MEKWLSIAAGIYLLAMVLYGHYRGFIRLAVSMVAVVASIIIVNAAMPQVTQFLKEDTKIFQSLSDSLKENSGLGDRESIDEDEDTEGLSELQKQMIDSLDLPQNIKDALIHNNNTEVYELLGVNAFTDYIGNYLADKIIRTIAFVLLFILVNVMLRLIMRWLDLIARLPILHGVNKIAGALLGGAEGLIFLWLVFMVLNVCSGTVWGMESMRQIEASKWLSFLYHYNLLEIIVTGVLHGMQ